MFYIRTTTNFLYKKEIREQNDKQIFLVHQVYKAPKEGQYWAEEKALMCSGKSTIAPPKNTNGAQVRHHP